MKKISDLTKYKKSKVIYNDLIAIKRHLEDCITKLEKYRQYMPVKESLAVLKDSKTIIDIHYSTHRRVIETLGAIDD